MAPSFDCALNLFCDDEATESIWEDDEVVSHNDEEYGAQEAPNCLLPDLPVEDDGVIAVLVEKEVFHMPQQHYLKRFSNLNVDADSRWEAIKWILKVQADYQFGPLTAYLSVNYLDRFLSSHQLPQGNDWMLQLLSVACVSLAAKMEELDVPLLLDLQVGDVKYVFEARTIQRMELLILSILKWRLSSVTPFSYIGYLLRKIGMQFPFSNPLILRVTELILATFRQVEFSLNRPSVIAIASVIAACEEFFAMEAETYREILLCALPVNQELCTKCYKRMRELVIDPFWTSKQAAGTAASRPGSPNGVLDAAACLSSVDSDQSSKARPLELNDAGKDGATTTALTTAWTPLRMTGKRKSTEL